MYELYERMKAVLPWHREITRKEIDRSIRTEQVVGNIFVLVIEIRLSRLEAMKE